MSKVLVLGATGSGKSTSIGNIPKLGIEGLNPKETFIIGCSSKGLPFKGWIKNYPRVKVKLNPQGIILDIAPDGNYYMTNIGENVAQLITLVNAKREDIQNIIIDDLNYVMQDYYMMNAVKGGYDVFKKIGLFMGAIFNAIEKVQNKNVFVMAHYEEYKAKNSEVISYRFKTVGNMVQNYSTPEGKFEIVLFTTQSFDEESKTITKRFVTNYDGEYPAKSPIDMFENIYIPNDLGYVSKKFKAYNEG